MKEPVIKSSGNVFIDLGFDEAEAAVLQMRAKLMSDLRAFVMSKGMTQMEAAKRFGVAQSRVSDLMRGKWDKFNLEMLISLEARIGRKVKIELAAYEDQDPVRLVKAKGQKANIPAGLQAGRF